jgi:hypothetical protein
MLTKVEVRTTLGMLLSIMMDDISDGLVIEDIQGLEPVKATLSSSPHATMPGAQFQASHREPRNILLSLGLEPDYVSQSIRSLRDNLYNFFMPGGIVDLRFFSDDAPTLDISAVVETMDTSYFSNEPKAVISLMCFDPDFLELEPIEVEGETVDDATEFLVTSEGTVETGFTFVLNVDRALTEFSIYHRPPDNQVRTMDFAASLVADDIVTIVTVKGEKVVTLTRASVVTSVLYAVSPQSNYHQLQPGDNYLRVFAEGDPIPFTIEYTPRYGGL